MRFLRGPAAVAGVALVIGVLAAVRLLAVADWDPTVFTAFGEEAADTTEYAESRLNREVLTRGGQGHDGKFFFVQANDPWILEPGENAEILDRPIYRAQRMLYPVLAGGGGLFGAEVVVWAMPIVNILLLAVGSWAVASIATKRDVSAWLGLAFALNIGLLSELYIDGAGITAFALTALGAWALESDRTLISSLAFTGSVLTREVMAIFVAFLALFWLIRRKKIPWAAVLPPAAALFGWAAYLRYRIDVSPDVEQVREITLTPFSGVVDALSSGRADMIDYLVIAFFLTLIFLVPFRAWKSDVFLTWGAVGFAALGPFLSVQVWQKSFDISRALAPLVTVFVLELFINRARRGESAQPTSDPAPVV